MTPCTRATRRNVWPAFVESARPPRRRRGRAGGRRSSSRRPSHPGSGEPGERGAEVGRAPQPGPAARDVDHVGLQRVAAHRRQRTAARREARPRAGAPTAGRRAPRATAARRVEPVQPVRAVVRRRDGHDRPPGRALGRGGRHRSRRRRRGRRRRPRRASRGTPPRSPRCAPSRASCGRRPASGRHAPPPSPRSSRHSQGRSRAPWPGRELSTEGSLACPQAVARTARYCNKHRFPLNHFPHSPEKPRGRPYTPAPAWPILASHHAREPVHNRPPSRPSRGHPARASRDRAVGPARRDRGRRSRRRSDSTPSSSTSTGPPGTTSR